MALLDTENVVWYYDSSHQPCAEGPSKPSSPPQWKEYHRTEIDIIEKAYQAASESLCLDGYRIDLKNFVQVRIDDDSKRRAVKREAGSSVKHGAPPTRFTDTQAVGILREGSACNGFDSWCPFLKAWLESDLGRRVIQDLDDCIEPCAQGILQEALAHDHKSNKLAAEMAGELRQSSGRLRREVSELCMRFHTRACFLYFALNRALRECDLTKLETLGPFAYLLHNHARTGKEYCGIVYRGSDLAATHIEQYKKALGTWKSWPSYTSTSRDRRVAELFGNMLFVITITGGLPTTPRGFDVSDLAQFPEEAEVVIPPGTSFLVKSVEIGPKQKYIISLRL